MQYRSRTDIAAAILDITKEGARKTRIMYRAYVSHPQLRDYLEMLTESGLLWYAGENTMKYHTTQKGLRFLNMYNELDSMIPEANVLTKKLK